jgi:hypothetical protein
VSPSLRRAFGCGLLFGGLLAAGPTRADEVLGTSARVRLPAALVRAFPFGLVRHHGRWLVGTLGLTAAPAALRDVVTLRPLARSGLGPEAMRLPLGDERWPLALLPGPAGPWVVTVRRTDTSTVEANALPGGPIAPLGVLPGGIFGAAMTRTAFLGGAEPAGIVVWESEQTVPWTAAELRRQGEAQRHAPPGLSIDFAGARAIASTLGGTLLGRRVETPWRERFSVPGPLEPRRLAAAASDRWRAAVLTLGTTGPHSTARIRIVRLDPSGATLPAIVERPLPAGFAPGDALAVNDAGEILIPLLASEARPDAVVLERLDPAGRATELAWARPGPLFPSDVGVLACGGAFWVLAFDQSPRGVTLAATRVDAAGPGPTHELWRAPAPLEAGPTAGAHLALEMRLACASDRAGVMFSLPGGQLGAADWDPTR